MITNDDGINSPGLIALVEAVMPLAEVVVVAPASQQTNMGRGSLKSESVGVIHALKINCGSVQHKAYAIEGSPAQAVAHGILEICPRMPDLCVSGVNYGENLGLAFTCSGTLGALFEADSFGIPGIAFSRVIPFENQRLDDFQELDWTQLKVYVKKIVQRVLLTGMLDSARILNVNFPSLICSNMEMRLTQQAYLNCGMYIKPQERPFNKPYQLKWHLNERIDEALPDTDIYAIHHDGVISITPLTSKMSVDIKNIKTNFE